MSCAYYGAMDINGSVSNGKRSRVATEPGRALICNDS